MNKTKLKEHSLLLILIIFTVAVRLMYPYQTDFDSYWIHGMSESITEFGYAKWVFHPASIFGYYPLSYPSGLMFFLAFISTITGLTMNATILYTGITLGVFGSILVFLIGRKLGGFFVGYLAALLFTLSPQIIYYSSYIASGRYLLMVFYLVFLLLLMEILHLIGLGFDHDLTPKEHNIHLSKKVRIKRLIKYIIVTLIFFVVMFMVHRTSQLTVLFVISAFLTYGYYIARPIWSKLTKINFIGKITDKLLISRYKKNNKLILIDIMVIVFVIIGIKLFDLVRRDRLQVNIDKFAIKIAPGAELIWNWLQTYMVYVTIISIIILVLIIFGLKKGLYTKINNWYGYHYKKVSVEPEKYLFRGLLAVAILLFVIQFFGLSFYSPSLEDYSTSRVITGNNPFVIFVNFLINYTTSVSILTIFGIIGIIILFLKDKKEPSDIFLIFLVLAFVGILVDKSYVKLFITPLVSIMIAYGIIEIYNYMLSKRKKIVPLFFIFLVILSTVAGAFVWQYRDIALDEISIFPYKEEYWNIGQYIASLDCDCSTITTDEQSAAVTIFASSKTPGGVHNIYYFINRSHLIPSKSSLGDIIDSLTSGKKVTQLWYLRDWIFGGEFYLGRHGKILLERDFRQRQIRQVIADYNEKYYIHDKSVDANNFYTSIEPFYNKVYDNPLGNVHDLEKGRALI